MLFLPCGVKITYITDKRHAAAGYNAWIQDTTSWKGKYEYHTHRQRALLVGRAEFEGLAGEEIGYRQMLDELRDTGYTGTELGDWGFMPT